MLQIYYIKIQAKLQKFRINLVNGSNLFANGIKNG